MNAERAALWIAALRSGEYQQDKGSLRTKAGFCCLGVACDIYHKVTGNGVWHHFSEGNIFWVDDFQHSGALSSEVMEWFGMKTKYGSLPPLLHRAGGLAAMNDRGSTFEEIATVIENNIEVL